MCSEDIACGTERLRIPCINTVDDSQPSGFTYITHSAAQLQLSSAGGCSCTGRCSVESGCSCAAGEQHCQVECGSACQCGPCCGRRASQQGLSAPVQLRKGAKGWSVHAAEPIPQGAFVASYIGEHLNSREAERRLREYDEQHGSQHALLVIKEFLPSGACLRLNIDGTKQGNIARFFNHSCDGGNLALDIVRSRGDLMPRVALFAARGINCGGELTFAYGEPSAGPADGGAESAMLAPPQRCLCNTSSCLGFLPRGGR